MRRCFFFFSSSSLFFESSFFALLVCLPGPRWRIITYSYLPENVQIQIIQSITVISLYIFWLAPKFWYIFGLFWAPFSSASSGFFSLIFLFFFSFFFLFFLFSFLPEVVGKSRNWQRQKIGISLRVLRLDYLQVNLHWFVTLSACSVRLGKICIIFFLS